MLSISKLQCGARAGRLAPCLEKADRRERWRIHTNGQVHGICVATSASNVMSSRVRLCNLFENKVDELLDLTQIAKFRLI